jgi:hypothetical protein
LERIAAAHLCLRHRWKFSRGCSFLRPCGQSLRHDRVWRRPKSERYGTVFRLSPSGGMWSETILHRLSNGKDSAEPAVQFINPNLLSSVRALVIVCAVHDYFLFSAGAANHTLRPTPDAARSAISFGLRERSARLTATVAQCATLHFWLSGPIWVVVQFE